MSILDKAKNSPLTKPRMRSKDAKILWEIYRNEIPISRAKLYEKTRGISSEETTAILLQLEASGLIKAYKDTRRKGKPTIWLSIARGMEQPVKDYIFPITDICKMTKPRKPRAGQKALYTTISSDLHWRLRQYAATSDLILADIIEQAINNYISQ